MKISQREARRLKKLVAELLKAEDMRRAQWVSDYPGGVHIGTVTFENNQAGQVTATRIARKLNHAVVAVDSGREIYLYALPLPKVPQ